ncbi:hypothetical protein JYU09_01490, partial [bacterium AH-315-O15]|nr:hypothetical protein [bacterium AH-315-O15]
KGAANDVFATLSNLGIDPVGGLPKAYNGLGESRALGVGLAFGVAFAICLAIAILQVPFPFVDLTGFGGFIKLLNIGIVPFIGLAAASFLVGKIGHATTSIQLSTFIAGVALLPLGLAMLIASLVGLGNLEVSIIVVVVAFCLHVLILFAGLTRIGVVTDKVASYSVPAMLIASAWLSKVLFVALFY